MSNRRSFLKQGALASAAFFSHYSLAAEARSLSATDDSLPARYYERLGKWCSVVQEQLSQAQDTSLKALEAAKGWYHFPYTVLPAAVLYAKQSSANPHYQDPTMLTLAKRIGDILTHEDQQNTFAPRLDSYRDTYMWAEAYELLKNDLSVEQKKQWAAAIERNVSLLVPELASWIHLPAYTENFIGTSPNHFAWWAATVLVAGIYLQKPEWISLGGGVLKRFATTEQNPDGYWGEHNPNGPTGGYNYLTTLAVGVYYEHTKDPDALKALRRATDFHTHTTYPDGNLIELFNDRNRYWHISYWGTFAFTHFPEGRGYAAFLETKLDNSHIDLDQLGLLAQNALYYHAGPTTAPAPLQTNYSYRLHTEAGVRKQGPWITGLCGIVDTPLPRSQWFLDRQSNLSLFHEKTGPIFCGSNSKHQPELASFSEKIGDTWYTTPKGSRLSQTPAEDSLAVAFNSFSAEIDIPTPTTNQLKIDIALSGRGAAPQEAYFGLQIYFKPGQTLTTGNGRSISITSDKLNLNGHDLGGSISHNGWTLNFDSDATLQWPVYPYNPYRNGPETKLEYAVALLRLPLLLKSNTQTWLQVNERTIHLSVLVA